jgi:SnoaL-like domain
MLDEAAVHSLERHWEQGWNQCDLDTIMEVFAADVLFSSPFVPRLTGDPEKTTIRGYDALRSYVADSLRRAGDVRYSLGGTCVGSDSLILNYTCHFADGTRRTGADSMRVDRDGMVVEWRSHYSFDPAEVQHLIRS